MNNDLYKSLFAGIFSSITIGALALLTYETELGVFLIASFGASMVLLYGYPESPFAPVSYTHLTLPTILLV